MREVYEIIETAMIINWCVVLRVQSTLGSTSFFTLCFLSLPDQVTSVVLFNIGPVTPNRINGLFDSVRKPRQIPSTIRMNIQISGFEYCEKLSFHILLSTVAICANSNF